MLIVKVVNYIGAPSGIPKAVLENMLGVCFRAEVDLNHYVIRGDEFVAALRAHGRTVALEYHAPLTHFSRRTFCKERCQVLN